MGEGEAYHPERVEVYRKLNTVKFFGGGRQSKEVRLLEGGKVVAKHFDRANPKHKKAFKLEVKHFKMLKGCKFVPKMLAADPEKLVLYTTYCGGNPEKYTKELKKEVREKVQELRKKYKLTRRFHTRLDGLPRLANVTIKDGKVHLIDMGPPFHVVN